VALRIGIPLFAAAFVADLVTKVVAVNGHWAVYFHDVPSRLPRRLLMIALAVAATVLLTKLSARRRDLGRPWGAWIGMPILAAGILGNGVSPFFWHGVPDFIWTGDSIMNVADFEIFFGIVGGVAALAVGYCITFGREALAR
jgi:signal peptidase (SPase) II